MLKSCFVFSFHTIYSTSHVYIFFSNERIALKPRRTNTQFPRLLKKIIIINKHTKNAFALCKMWFQFEYGFFQCIRLIKKKTHFQTLSCFHKFTYASLITNVIATTKQMYKYCVRFFFSLYYSHVIFFLFSLFSFLKHVRRGCFLPYFHQYCLCSPYSIFLLVPFAKVLLLFPFLFYHTKRADCFNSFSYFAPFICIEFWFIAYLPIFVCKQLDFIHI